MKRFFKQNAGFTLVELIVAMAIATLVTAAATSVLFMGLRINRQTGDTASRQMTVSTLLNTVEKIISEGNVSDIEMHTEHWRIKDKSGKVLLAYWFDEEEQGTVYVGNYPEDALDAQLVGTPVLTGLLSSYVELYDGLFTISVETKEGVYASSVYCRALTPETDGDVSNGDSFVTEGSGQDKKTLFLNALKSQYTSHGEIMGVDPQSLYQYFSEWYIQKDYDDGIYDNGWNAKTPWCACYVSWALNQAQIQGPSTNHSGWYANVDEFMAYFQREDQDQKWFGREDATPEIGDLIFFDWKKGSNPQHMGVVLNVTSTMVYTIEGNSAGRVTVRSYPIGDKRIIGYGRLPWQSE